MTQLTLVNVWQQLAYLPTSFRLGACALVLLLTLVCIALPTVMLVVATLAQYKRSRATQGHLFRLLTVNSWIGQPVAWLIVFLMLIQVAIIVLRHVFDLGSLRAQETTWYLHGTIIMLGAGYTCVEQRHVRLDVWYRHVSAQGRVKIDLLGHLLFLIPFSVTLIYVSFQYVATSLAIRESSPVVGGLPLLFVMKSLILVFALLLLLYALTSGARLISQLGVAHRLAKRESL